MLPAVQGLSDSISVIRLWFIVTAGEKSAT